MRTPNAPRDIGPGDSVRDLQQALLSLDRVKARQVFSEASLQAGPLELVEALMVPALARIGDEWAAGGISLSSVYMAGRLCEGLVDAVLPAVAPGRRRQPAVAIAVLEDYHTLGLRIVYSGLRAAGFELHDYGRVTVEELAARAAQDSTAVLLVSVLMLPSALRVKELCALLRQSPSPPKVIVGGAPFRLDPLLAAEVGADAHGDSVRDAVSLVRGFLEAVP